MKKYSIFVLLASVVILFSACKGDEEPYIVFKDSSGNALSADTQYISLNSIKTITVESGFIEKKKEHNMIHYQMQIDNSPEYDLLFYPTIFKINTVGVYNNLTTEKAQIVLSFNESPFKNKTIEEGTVIKISVFDDKSLQKSVLFKIQ